MITAARDRLRGGATRRRGNRFRALRCRTIGRSLGRGRAWPVGSAGLSRRRVLRALPRGRHHAFAPGAAATCHRDGGVRACAAACRPGRVHPAPGDRVHLGVGHRATTSGTAGDCRSVHRVRRARGRAGPPPRPAGPGHRHRRLRCRAGLRAPQQPRGRRWNSCRPTSPPTACFPNSTARSTWSWPTRPMFPTVSSWIPKWPTMIRITRCSAVRTV